MYSITDVDRVTRCIIGWDVARWDLEELEDLVLRFRPKLLYVNPTYQNPTGRTMPGGLRHGLLDLAARYHLPVIEDEPSRELWFSTPPPDTPGWPSVRHVTRPLGVRCPT